MPKDFTITTVITSLNMENSIADSIKSFLEQDYPYKQLVIVDGKSTDNSHEIIADFVNKHQDIITWVKEYDKNLSDARNIAIKHTKGNIIGFLGADDLLCKGIFTKIAEFTKIADHYDAIYFNSYIIAKNEIVFRNSATIEFNKRNLRKLPPIVPGEAIYYKKELFDCHKFNEKNPNTLDYEFNMDLVTANKNYIFCPLNETGVYWINKNGHNISSIHGKEQRYETIAIMFKYCKRYSDYKKIIGYNLKNILKNYRNIKNAYNKIK